MQRGRRQVMIDQQVQGILIGRVLLYWFASHVAIVVSFLVWSAATVSPNDPPASIPPRILQLLPALIGSQLLLPLVLADFLRVSNRFVGPIWNLRNAMKRVELGDAVPPLRLRQADFWPDLLGRFNRLLPRLQPPTRALHGSESDLSG